MITLCLLCTLAGSALAQTAETPPETAQTGGWPEEMIGSWVGLRENLLEQYTFYRNGKYDLTVFEDPSLDRSGMRETLGKDYSIAVVGDLMKLTVLRIMSTFRRMPESITYVRLKTKVAAVDPSVTTRLLGTWGGRIKETYVEWTFGADGSFSQVTPAEASVLYGYYIAGGLELAIKLGGKFIHCAYVIRQDTMAMDLPDDGKVILYKKAGQLKSMFLEEDFGWLWTKDREPSDQVPRGPILGRYLGSENEVAIPGYLAYVGVVGIGDEAFKGNKTIQSVTIPDFVTKIGSSAFEGCESLRDVLFIGTDLSRLDQATYKEVVGFSVIPGSCPLKTIGEGAFRGCVNLENLNIARSARESPLGQYFPQIIWSDIKGINIPDGVTSIGAYAFEGCQSVTCVSIPDSVTSIGAYAFEGCQSVTGISIPDSVTEIGMNAFKGCDRVTLIVGKDSYPMRYAGNYGIPFILRGE